MAASRMVGFGSVIVPGRMLASQSMQVPLVDLASEHAPIRDDLAAALVRVLDSGRFIGGPEVEAFEAELAEACGCAHAVGVSSGTDALLVALMAHDIGRGDEVVTTPFSFFATAGAIARLGATPVFADIDPVSFHLDGQSVSAVVTQATRAVVPVSLFGLAQSLELSGRDHLVVIDDAAQAIAAGPVRGAASTLSFFPAKTLGALGDGGAVLTGDGELAERIALLRNHGARPKYHHGLIGGNFRLDAVQAAVLRVKLPRLAQAIEARRQAAARYRQLLSGCGVAAPADEAVVGSDVAIAFPPDRSGHVYHHFVVRADKRDELRDHLAARGIGTAVYYPEPLHIQPCFAHLGYRTGQFPVAEAACRQVLALPMHPGLSEAAQAHVVDSIAGFFRR